MKNITIPISTPKKILGRGTRIIPVQKELDTAEQPLSSLKGTASGSVGASVLRTVPILVSSKTGSETSGVTPRRSSVLQSDAALAAHLPLDFPVDAWDKMSTKAQLQAMKFSGLTATEQWRLLNLPVPLADLVTAGRAKQEFIVAHAGGKVLPAREPNTES